MNILLLSAVLCLMPADDEVIGRIDGQDFGAEKFGAWLVDRIGLTHVHDYLREEMFLLAGEREDALPTDEEVEAAWQAERATVINNVHHGSAQDWVASLRERGTTPAREAERRRAGLRADLVLLELTQRSRQFTEEDLRQRYRDIYGSLNERISLRVLKFDMWAKAQTGDGELPDQVKLRADALERAEAASAAWKAGADFEQLVKQADDPASDFVHAGELEVYRKLLLGQQVENAVRQLDDVGEVSLPIEVWDGYFVIQLVNRTTASFEEARDEMETLLRESPPTAEELGVTELALRERFGPEVTLR
ncbi:MAG: hypothetical protein DHS20C15_00190 [Planctomycetota bacterium]|nr:MAG: hypothetical protein DHS20C15_00190 [Planctomycetota bacterium]